MYPNTLAGRLTTIGLALLLAEMPLWAAGSSNISYASNAPLRGLGTIQGTAVPTSPTAPQQNTNASQQSPAQGCKQPCLEDGTPVKLRISQTVACSGLGGFTAE